MPKKIFPINIKKPFTEQELVGHNRWHPDIPAVVSVNPALDRWLNECRLSNRSPGQVMTGIPIQSASQVVRPPE